MPSISAQQVYIHARIGDYREDVYMPNKYINIRKDSLLHILTLQITHSLKT